MAEKITSPVSGKKSIERSASYPATTIQDTLNFIGTISKNFTPQHIITRDDISAVTKIKTVHRITASAVQYGLLTLIKGGYKLSQLYRDFTNPVSPEEKQGILLSFFKSPKIYNDLIESYNQHVVPPELKSILIRNHKIAPNAANEVAEVFIENARFVGALNEAGILDVSIDNISVQIIEKDKIDPILLKNIDTTTNIVDNITRLFDSNHGQEDVKVVLTEGKYCFIKYPKNLNDKDILILQKWIELLELTLK